MNIKLESIIAFVAGMILGVILLVSLTSDGGVTKLIDDCKAQFKVDTCSLSTIVVPDYGPL